MLVTIEDQDLGYDYAFQEIASEVFAIEYLVVTDFVFLSELPGRYIFVATVKFGARGVVSVLYFLRWHVLPMIFRESTGY